MDTKRAETKDGLSKDANDLEDHRNLPRSLSRSALTAAPPDRGFRRRGSGEGRSRGSDLSDQGAISAELAAQGHLNERGRPFAAKSVASMLKS